MKLKLSALHACVLVQTLEGIGDDETFQNHNEQDKNYLLLVGDRLYHVTSDGSIRVAEVKRWTDMELVDR